jgi:hypothetical protein
MFVSSHIHASETYFNALKFINKLTGSVEF